MPLIPRESERFSTALPASHKTFSVIYGLKPTLTHFLQLLSKALPCPYTRYLFSVFMILLSPADTPIGLKNNEASPGGNRTTTLHYPATYFSPSFESISFTPLQQCRCEFVLFLMGGGGLTYWPLSGYGSPGRNTASSNLLTCQIDNGRPRPTTSHRVGWQPI